MVGSSLAMVDSLRVRFSEVAAILVDELAEFCDPVRAAPTTSRRRTKHALRIGRSTSRFDMPMEMAAERRCAVSGGSVVMVTRRVSRTVSPKRKRREWAGARAA